MLPQYIDPDREGAIRRCREIIAKKAVSKVVYTDGSVANKRCGSAVVQLDGSNRVLVVRTETIATDKTCSISSAEITAIRLAIDHIRNNGTKRTPYWILSDSQDAIRILSKGKGTNTSGAAAMRLLITARQAQELGFDVHIVWCPGHSQIEGNMAADRAAKAMTVPGAKSY